MAASSSFLRGLGRAKELKVGVAETGSNFLPRRLFAGWEHGQRLLVVFDGVFERVRFGGAGGVSPKLFSLA